MYVAVKGGEKAISAAHELLRREGRGDPSVPDLGIEQLIGQLRLAVDRVMAEGSLYDRDLAALAIKQAQGDLLEAVFLVRAYRTTLPPVRQFACRGHVSHARAAAHFRHMEGSPRRTDPWCDVRLHAPPAGSHPLPR